MSALEHSTDAVDTSNNMLKSLLVQLRQKNATLILRERECEIVEHRIKMVDVDIARLELDIRSESAHLHTNQVLMSTQSSTTQASKQHIGFSDYASFASEWSDQIRSNTLKLSQKSDELQVLMKRKLQLEFALDGTRKSIREINALANANGNALGAFIADMTDPIANITNSSVPSPSLTITTSARALDGGKAIVAASQMKHPVSGSGWNVDMEEANCKQFTHIKTDIDVDESDTDAEMDSFCVMSAQSDSD